MKLKAMSIKTDYKKGFLSKTIQVMKGSDIELLMKEMEWSVDKINSCIKCGIITNVEHPNLDYFEECDEFYQVRIFEDEEVHNSLIHIEEKEDIEEPLALSEKIIDSVNAMFKLITDEVVEKTQVCKTMEYLEFLTRIKKLNTVDIVNMPKQTKFAFVLNVYQAMFFHSLLIEWSEIEVQSTGILSILWSLFFNSETNKGVTYRIANLKINLYEMKNIVIRQNSKPSDAYFKLTNDQDPRINFIESIEKKILKIATLCLPDVPGTTEEIEDFNLRLKFVKFHENVIEEFVKVSSEFITLNVHMNFEDGQIKAPKYFRNYLGDFGGDESEMFKMIGQNHEDKNIIPISQLVKRIKEKDITISYY